MNPILKIKRNVNTFPTGLTPGELAVDLGIKKLYVGNNSSVSIPISAQVSSDVTLGGSNASHDVISTQNAIKTYIDNTLINNPPPVAPPKETLLARFTGQQLISNVAITPTNQFELYNTPIITQTANMGIQIEDPNDPVSSGFFQTTKTSMTLNVNYSVYFSSVDTSVIAAEGTNLGTFRLVGLRLINKSNSTANYYGIQTVLPAIGNENVGGLQGLPTLINGNATIVLPKYTSTAKWEIQLIYQVRSNDSTLFMGNLLDNVIDPVVSDGYGVRIEMIKLGEVQ
jgi:hypothetical protein